MGLKESGEIVDAAARLHLARLGRKHRGIQITFMDEVEPPKEKDGYVTLDCFCEGVRVQVLVLTRDRFYEALGKVVRATMPARRGAPLN